MKVLAIDPGFDRLGVAVVTGDASRPIVIFSDCIEPPKGEREARLAAVHDAVAMLIHEYAPDRFALESLFFSTNKKTALGVAEARGAALSAAGEAGLPVKEYSPGTIKNTVTGNGRADKAAIARMIPRLVSLPEKPRRRDDEFDAIAVGITALADRFPQ